MSWCIFKCSRTSINLICSQKTISRLKKATTTSTPDSQTQHNDVRNTMPTVTSGLLPQAPNSSISHPSLTASHPTDLMLPPASSHPSLKIYTNMPLNMSTKSDSMAPHGASHLTHFSGALSIPRVVDTPEQRRMALEADRHSEIVEHVRNPIIVFSLIYSVIAF